MKTDHDKNDKSETKKVDPLFARVQALKLHGVAAHWDEVEDCVWISDVVTWEEDERIQRSLDRRLKNTKLSTFKPLSHFDWSWPKKCDREAIESLMDLGFLKNATNIILCGPNGVGKSTIASNLAYQSVIQGHTAIFITAAQLLNELAAQESDAALRRRLKQYTQPDFLLIDEVGYLSFSNRYADLLFEVISQRYEKKSTLITTNKPFTEWGDIFPSASCVVSLIDRLVHHSEIISIEADSFRLKEAKEKAQEKKGTPLKLRGKKEPF